MFFGSSCVCGFSGGSFPVSGSGGLLMSGTNMSIVWGQVVKGSATSTTSKRTFGSSLVVGFQVTSEVFLFPELFVAAGTFVNLSTSLYMEEGT